MNSYLKDPCKIDNYGHGITQKKNMINLKFIVFLYFINIFVSNSIPNYQLVSLKVN